MTRYDEAKAFLVDWDPDAMVLPDWVADEMDDHEDLRALFDERFTPWDGAELGQPEAPKRRRPAILWAIGGVGVAGLGVAAGLMLSVLVFRSPAPENSSPFELSERPPPDGVDALLDITLGAPSVASAQKPDAKPRAPRVRVPELSDEYRTVPLQDRFEALPAPDDRVSSAGNLRESRSPRRQQPRANELTQDFLKRIPAGRSYDAAPTITAGVQPAQGGELPSTEDYTDYGANGFVQVAVDPLSTFGIDVDTASYTLTRRKLRQGQFPPKAAVRVEEFVNYLPYGYRGPSDDRGAPFAVAFEAAPNPFDPRTHWVRVGVQGKQIVPASRPSVHLTFLVDTSGSMQSPDKIGLVKTALSALTSQLELGDTVAVVAYAGSAGVILEPTGMDRRQAVLSALDQLTAGGSTAMGAGIELAYKLADRTYQRGAVNRVVILSDGDANVGITSHEVLLRTIRQYASRGIGLTTAGFGQGNYKDTMMERLANEGDGNYWYIDSEREARRVFVEKLTATLVDIARDVKLQLEWNPDNVEAYRLVGYENRDIADEDFRNDAVDAGEIGAGHQVTALYEVVLKPEANGTLATMRVRSKPPGPDAPAVERVATMTSLAMRSGFDQSSRDLQMAVTIASFAERLRDNLHAPQASYRDLAQLARRARRDHPEDRELIELIDQAARLAGEGR